MKVTRVEYRQVTSTIDYDIPEEDIVRKFGSIDNFKKAESMEHESDFNQFIILPQYYTTREDVWSDNVTGSFDSEYKFIDDLV